MNLTPKQRVFLLICIMVSAVLVVEAVVIGMLYHTALREERSRLEETVKSQARLMEAIARFDAKYNTNYPFGSREATLSQIIDAHRHYQGFGNTGEFVLARKENDKIVFLMDHRNLGLKNPNPIPFQSNLAEPIKQALSGKSGTIIGRDYRGVRVVAAHEPVAELNLGIVAKIDLAEVRAPFIKAGLISGLFGLLVVVIGSLFFIRVTNPLIEKLFKTIEKLQEALTNIKTLSGLLPICSACKKIRDDKGYWKQIELYVKEHTEAEFSHSICPECAKKLYPHLIKEE